MEQSQKSYTINLDFEEIKLPPVSDILVLGKKVPQGKQGILHSFNLILPDVFEMQEINDPKYPQIDAVIVNKAILAKIPMQEIISVLTISVFPYVVRGETIKVNIDIHIFYKNITGEFTSENI